MHVSCGYAYHKKVMAYALAMLVGDGGDCGDAGGAAMDKHIA